VRVNKSRGGDARVPGVSSARALVRDLLDIDA
jgi:hypothetical protein